MPESVNPLLRPRPSVVIPPSGLTNPLLTQTGLNNAIVQNQAAQAAALATPAVPAPQPLGTTTQGTPVAPTAVATPEGGIDWSAYKTSLGDAYAKSSSYAKEEHIKKFVEQVAEANGMTAQERAAVERQINDLEKDTLQAQRESGKVGTTIGAATEAVGGLIRGVGDIYDMGQNFLGINNGQSDLSAAGEGVTNFARDNLISADMRDKLQRIDELVGEGRAGDAAAFAVQNPSTLAYLATTALAPSMIPVGSGAAAARAAGGLARVQQAGQKVENAAQALDRLRKVELAAGPPTAATAGRVAQATSALDDAQSAVKTAKRVQKAAFGAGVAGAQYTMVGGQMLNEYVEQGGKLTPEIESAIRNTSLVSAGLAVAGMPLGTIEGALMRTVLNTGGRGVTEQVAEKAATGFLSRLMGDGIIAKTAQGGLRVTRAVAPEAIQELADEFVQSVGQSGLDPETGTFDWGKVDWDQAGASAVIGGMVGGVMGGAVNRVTRPRGSAPEQTMAPEPGQPSATPPTVEDTPPVLDAPAAGATPAQEPQSVWREAMGQDAPAVEQMLMQRMLPAMRILGTNGPATMDTFGRAEYFVGQLEARAALLDGEENLSKQERETLRDLRQVVEPIRRNIQTYEQTGASADRVRATEAEIDMELEADASREAELIAYQAYGLVPSRWFQPGESVQTPELAETLAAARVPNMNWFSDITEESVGALQKLQRDTIRAAHTRGRELREQLAQSTNPEDVGRLATLDHDLAELDFMSRRVLTRPRVPDINEVDRKVQDTLAQVRATRPDTMDVLRAQQAPPPQTSTTQEQGRRDVLKKADGRGGRPAISPLRNGETRQFSLKDGSVVNASKRPYTGGAPMAPGYSPRETDPAVITVTDKDGAVMGEVYFSPGSAAMDIEVDEVYRRRGVGTLMYDLAEASGADLEGGAALGTLSDDALATRAARAVRNQPNPLEQGRAMDRDMRYASLEDIQEVDQIVQDGRVYREIPLPRVYSWLTSTLEAGDSRRALVEWLATRPGMEPRVFTSDSGLFDGSYGYYDPATNRIYIDTTERAHQASTMIHELTHVATVHALSNPDALSPSQREAYDTIMSVYEQFQRGTNVNSAEGRRTRYARTNEAEFVAEVFANDALRRRLDRMNTREKKRTGLRGWWDMVKQLLFGRSGNVEFRSALDDVVDAIQRLQPASERLRKQNAALDRRYYGREADGETPTEPVTGIYVARDPRTGLVRGSSRLDPETGTWTLRWQDQFGNEQSLLGVLEDEIQVLFDSLGLRADSRQRSITPDDNALYGIEIAKSYDPRITPFVNGMQKVFGNTMTDKALKAGRYLTQQFANKYEPIVRLETYLNNTYGTNYTIANQIIERFARARSNINRPGLVSEPSLFDLKEATTELLRHHNLDAEQFSDYLYAMHAAELHPRLTNTQDPLTGLERLDRTSGFSWKDQNGNVIEDPDGSKFLSRLTDEQKRILEVAAEPLRKANRMVLQAELASGLIDESQFHALSEYDYYVPLRNAEMTNLAKLTERTGRFTKADDPYAMMIAVLDARMTRVGHNDAMGLLFDINQQHPVPEFFTVNEQEFDTPSEMWRNADLFGDNSVYYYRNGRKYRITAKDEQMKDLFKPQRLSKGLAAIANTTQMYGMMRTQLNPVFVFKTLTQWDALTSLANAQGAFEGAVQDSEAMQVTRGIFSNGFRALGDIAKGNLGRTDNFKVRAFQAFGGGIEPGSRGGYESAVQWLKRRGAIAPSSRFDALKTKAANTMSKVNMSLHSLEDMYRYGAFITYLEMRHGRPFQTEAELLRFVEHHPEHLTAAITGSKNITTNFEVKGNNPYMRTFYVFFNAAMRGAMQTLPQIMGSAHGRKMSAIMMVGALMAAQGVMDEVGEDEDGKNRLFRYRDLGRKLYLDKDTAIDLPHELRWANSAVIGMLGIMTGNMTEMEAISLTAGALADATNPLSEGPSNDLGLQMATAITPTVLDWVLPLATGKDAFGRPIAAEYVYDPITGKRIDNPADYERGRPQDSAWSKDAAEWLAENTGGMVDVLPFALENAVRFVLGANYDTAKGIMREMNNEGADPTDAVLNAITRSTKAQYDDYAIQSEFRETEKEWGAALRRHQQAEGGEINMLTSSGQTAAKIAAVIQKANKDMRALKVDGEAVKDLFARRTAAQEIGDKDSVLDVKQRIDALYGERRRIMAEALLEIKHLEETP